MRINKSLITYQPSSGAGSGTVTSVALSAPTGFTVSGSPVTTSGTLALAFTTGYGIPPLMTGNSGKFLTTNGTIMSWVNIAGTDVTGAALTENDDTNVTLTLGGTPSTALLRSVSMTLGWAGQLAVSRGGTGTSNLTGVVIGNNTSAMTSVTGTALQIFRVNSAGSGYEFFTATFLSNPMTTSGDIIYGGVSGAPTRLGANTTPTNMFLRSVSSGAPSWEPITSADITGAALTRTNDTNVTLTLGGSPSTALLNAASLTLGWSGTLAVGRGGTGASTLTGVLVGNGTSAFTAVVGTAGQFLRRNTANTAYEFRTLQGADIAGSELTFANDTNVTMTLGGTPASALLQPVSINLGWTGQLAVSRGGTGASTLTGVLIGNGTSAVTAITGTANQILRRNSGNTAYEFWSANYLVNPMTLEGSIIYATTGGTPTELFANSTSTNKYLRSVNGTAPTWETITGFLTGSGTTNYIPKWTSSTDLGNSQIQDNGTNVGIGISPSHKLDVNGNIGISGTIFLSKSGTSNVIYDSTGGTSILIGSSATAATYYTQTTHYFQSRSSVNYTTIGSSGIDVIGIVTAGNVSATNGSIMLQDNYSNGHFGNVGTMFSGGNFMLGYGVTPSTSSATAFLSSVFISGTDLTRSSMVLGENVSIYTGAAQSVAIGSSVTMSERFRMENNGRLRLNAYTSSLSFTGIAAGYLAFTSGGYIITTATPGGVSGTQDYLAKFDSTGIAVGNSRIVDNGTNFLLNSASAYVTGLNLIGDIGMQSASGQASSIVMRSNQTPTSGTSIGIIDSYAITTGSTYTLSAGMDFRASQNWNSTSAGTNIFVQTTPDNDTSPADMFVFLNNGAVRFIGRTSNPIGAAAGTMYYNSSANNMRYYNGTSWITF